MNSHPIDISLSKHSSINSFLSNDATVLPTHDTAPTSKTPLISHPILGDSVTEDESNAFIIDLHLGAYSRMSAEEKSEHLAPFDAIKMAEVLNYMRVELAEVKLESVLLVNFLEEHDAHTLLLLKEKRILEQKKLASSFKTQSIGSMTSSHSMDIASGITSRGRASVHRVYKMNYRAKIELAEKLQFQVEDKMKQLENRGATLLKGMQARINELKMSTHELKETTDNFKLHFMGTPADCYFLEQATERQLGRKLRKFVTNWAKSADALIAKARMREMKVDGSCRVTKANLIVKSELAVYLTAPDYEQLTILRDEQLCALDEKLMNRDGLRKRIGITARQVKVERNIMEATDKSLRDLEIRCKEVDKQITHVQSEVDMLVKDVEKETVRHELLKERMGRFAGPSVRDYVNKKQMLEMLEKEEKIMERKLGILKITWKNKGNKGIKEKRFSKMS